MYYKSETNPNKDTTEHFSSLITQNQQLELKQKILSDIINVSNNKHNKYNYTNKAINNKQKINIMVWNCNSLRTYTKSSYLIEQLLNNDIHIALIQETMLNENHKIYIKG